MIQMQQHSQAIRVKKEKEFQQKMSALTSQLEKQATKIDKLFERIEKLEKKLSKK